MDPIETILHVTEDGQATLQVPREVPVGPHPALVLIRDDPRATMAEAGPEFPLHDLGPWPQGLSLNRESIYGDDAR